MVDTGLNQEGQSVLSTTGPGDCSSPHHSLYLPNRNNTLLFALSLNTYNVYIHIVF